MIETLYEKMMIPKSCRLGKRVYKKLFHKNTRLNPADMKALREDVDTIVWQYTFKSTTLPIPSFEDSQREYLEIALLQVNLKQTGRTKRLAEIIHRAIPYPLFVVFVYETTCSISLANKRFSQTGNDAIVAEDFQMTGWLDLSNPTKYQLAFLNSLDISTWSHTHFLDFYKAAMNRVVALAWAEHTGRYLLDVQNGISLNDRVIRLNQLEKLQQEKTELASKLKNEKNLGTQVQMNTRVKNILDRITAIKREL